MSALPEISDASSASAPSAVAVHPERTDQPNTVHWRVAGRLPAVLPEDALRLLVDQGILEAVACAPDHIATTLAAGRSWAADGDAVRTGVQRAVAAGRALDQEAASADPDGALTRLATRILADEIAPYAAGHGGSIVLVDACDGTVDVEMTGACHGCPAAAFTIQGRLERRLREESPGPVEVRVVAPRRSP